MRYEAPSTVQAAVKLLASGGAKARVLAGGTDLLVQLRSGRAAPELVVDVKRIAGMRAIKKEAGGFRVGAAVPGVALGEDKALKKAWPGVVEAAHLIGSTQVQGRATMAGNLCNASPAADSVPALVAAGAKARVVGPKGKRDVPVEKIAVGPGKTSLGKGELIEIGPAAEAAAALGRRLSALHSAHRDGHRRGRRRRQPDARRQGRLHGGSRGPGRGGADACCWWRRAPRPSSAPRSTPRRWRNLAAACSAACRPIDDKRGTIEFRIEVAGVLARRAAEIALKRARGK